MTEEPPLIRDQKELLQYGVASRVPVCNPKIDATAWKRWAQVLSTVSPCIVMSEGDGEYAFYRNILDEPDFPFDHILDGEIGDAIQKFFPVQNLKEIRLDDAFCIHYNMTQEDTTGAKHMDPSDITVNLCITKSDDCKGSDVMFHGTKALQGVDSSIETRTDFCFRVNQEPLYATLHWGSHPHETTRLEKGDRTNIVLTYCFADPSRSDVSSRTCYNV
mgnify:CR=1 FL=1